MSHEDFSKSWGSSDSCLEVIPALAAPLIDFLAEGGLACPNHHTKPRWKSVLVKPLPKAFQARAADRIASRNVNGVVIEIGQSLQFIRRIRQRFGGGRRRER